MCSAERTLTQDSKKYNYLNKQFYRIKTTLRNILTITKRSSTVTITTAKLEKQTVGSKQGQLLCRQLITDFRNLLEIVSRKEPLTPKITPFCLPDVKRATAYWQGCREIILLSFSLFLPCPLHSPMLITHSNDPTFPSVLFCDRADIRTMNKMSSYSSTTLVFSPFWKIISFTNFTQLIDPGRAWGGLDITGPDLTSCTT